VAPFRRFLGASAALALFLASAGGASAGAVYPTWKQEVMQATANTSLTATVKCQLATSAYTYSAAHVFLSDVATGLISTAQTLATKTFAAGKFTAANITFTAVTTGSTATQVLCWVDTGTATSSRLVVDLTGISVVTNGGDITISWDATNGIFTL
jgi:hypothetical protein